METIDLPLVHGLGTTPDAALDLLYKKSRSGLVVEHDGEYTLLYFRHLLEAQRNNIDDVTEIAGYDVELLTPSHTTKFNLDLIRPMATQDKYNDFFAAPEAHEADYALFGATSEVAVIVTKHETLKHALSTGGFKCNGVPVHFFPDPEVVDGQNCPKYPECTGSGGAIPTVSRM